MTVKTLPIKQREVEYTVAVAGSNTVLFRNDTGIVDIITRDKTYRSRCTKPESFSRKLRPGKRILVRTDGKYNPLPRTEHTYSVNLKHNDLGLATITIQEGKNDPAQFPINLGSNPSELDLTNRITGAVSQYKAQTQPLAKLCKPKEVGRFQRFKQYCRDHNVPSPKRIACYAILAGTLTIPLLKTTSIGASVIDAMFTKDACPYADSDIEPLMDELLNPEQKESLETTLYEIRDGPSE
jgi:hypothetical protein